MGLRLPNLDYVSILGGIGDNLVNAYDKYQAPKLIAEALALQGGGQQPTPMAGATPTALPSAAMQPPKQDVEQKPPQPSGGLGALFQKAASDVGISPDYLTRTAFIESRGDPNAANPSGAKGLFQFMPMTAKQYGLDNPNDPAASTLAAARLAADNRGILTKTLGREPTDAELYLAHQQGAGGASKLLANPNIPAVAVVGQQAVIQNGGSPDMTAGQFAKLWTDKYNSVGGGQGGTSAPPSQLMAAGGAIPPSAGPRAPQYSPETIMRLMQNPYTRGIGTALMQKMVAGTTSEVKQFGDNLYRVGGDGSITPLGQIPQKETYQIHDGSIVKIGPNGAQVVGTLPKDRAPLVLSEGQTAFDQKTGTVFATGGQKNDVAKANQQREAEADRLGLKDEDRNQYILNGKIPAQAEKEATEAQANAANYATRMRAANEIMSRPEISAAGMGVTGAALNAANGLPLGIGNKVATKEYQQLEQAQRDFVSAVLRRESGAAISQAEFESEKKKYFPQPYDDKATIQQKEESRKRAIEGIAGGATPAFRKEFSKRVPLPSGYSAARAVSEAKAAIAAGRDPQIIKDKLKAYGIDPSNVDK